MQPFAVKTGSLLCVCVSTDEETGWEKSFTCGHTHESRESSHYEPCSVQTERWRGEKTARSHRWLCITSNVRCGKYMKMWCAEEGLLKMWQAKGRTESGKIILRVQIFLLQPWSGWCPVINTRAWPLTWKAWKDEARNEPYRNSSCCVCQACFLTCAQTC